MTRAETLSRRAAAKTLRRLKRETCVCSFGAVCIEEWQEGRDVIRDEMGKLHKRLLRDIFDDIERRAEANMMKTGKLEGMHYAALKDVRRELGIERKASGQEWRRPGLAVDAHAPFIVPVAFPALPKFPEGDDSAWDDVSLDQLRAWDWAAEPFNLQPETNPHDPN